jgi:hypothetical protein
MILPISWQLASSMMAYAPRPFVDLSAFQWLGTVFIGLTEVIHAARFARTTAIDICLVRVPQLIVAMVHANAMGAPQRLIAVDVDIRTAILSHAAGGAFLSAAVDVRLITVLDAVGARGFLADIALADLAFAIPG